ncbi:MAG: hypothetical protein BACD_04276 [Bacteroides rodentium]
MCSIFFYAYCVLTLALEGQGYFFYSLYVFLQKRGKDTDFAGKEMCFGIDFERLVLGGLVMKWGIPYAFKLYPIVSILCCIF